MPKARAAAGCDPPGGNRAQPGPAHPGVDVPVEPHVDGVGPARHQVAADHHPEHQRRRGQARRRDEHRGDRRHQQERDDPGLGERHQVGQQAGTAVLAGRIGPVGHRGRARGPPGVERQDDERGPDRRADQQVERPQTGWQELENHRRGDADLDQGRGHHGRGPDPKTGGLGPRVSPHPRGQQAQQHHEAECEGPVGPVELGQRPRRRHRAAVAERKPEAEQAGIEIGDLRAEEDHHEARGGGCGHQPMGRVAIALRQGTTAPAPGPQRQ